MREFLAERSDHAVSQYELPDALKRKIIDRLRPYIDRFGYRDTVEAAIAGNAGAKPKPALTESEPS
jgi:hypothetical protein